jgi:large subunit ribosomal protein L30
MGQVKTSAKNVRVTLVRSPAGRTPEHRACVAGLGLRRIRHSVVVADTREIRGMLNKVAYLLKIEDA